MSDGPDTAQKRARITMRVYRFTVLFPTDEAPGSLSAALKQADTGNAVGAEEIAYEAALHPSIVPEELRKLGNDGEFFDTELSDA